MNKNALTINFFGYGFSIEYRISEMRKDSKKYRLNKEWSEFNNPYIAFGFMYRYTIIFRLLIDRG